MKSKKLFAVLLTLTLSLGTALAGCGNKNKDKDVSGSNEPKVLDIILGTEPETLDCQKLTGAPDMTVVNMFIEGLTRFGKEEGKYEPGVAKSWNFDQASNTWTFELRSDSKWMDGTPITAKDFFLGWRIALDEQVQYMDMIAKNIVGAADYAAVTKESFLSEKDAAFKALCESRDAEKDKEKKKTINGQISDRIEKMTDAEKSEYQKIKDDLWAKVGVKDNNGKIEIKLATPVPYFLGLTAFPVFYPVNEKFYNEHKQKGDYTLEASGLNSNGPWIMKEWKHRESLVLEKNPNYWNKDAIKIDKINMKIVIDASTRMNLLKAGDIDGSFIPAANLKEFQDKATRDQYFLQDLADMPDYTVFYYEFNHFSNPITQNENIRKAIAYALDRKGFVEKISPGDLPALALIPDYFPGLSKSFREENGKTLFDDKQIDKSKEYLKKGLEELKMDKLAFDMLIDEGDVAKQQAEKIQSDLKEIGIDMSIVPLPWGEKLTRLRNGSFGIVASGWGPDYLDPMTFLDLFESTNGNNHGKFNSPEYDKLIDQARKEADPSKRMGYFYQAEKMLIEHMVIVPEYFRIVHYAPKDYLTGVLIRGTGPSPDFYNADIDMSRKAEVKKK